MTVLTTESLQTFVGNGVIVDFVFTYQAIDESDINPFIDDEPVVGGFVTVLNIDQNTTPGGTVTFDVAPVLDAKVDLLRLLIPTQELDYTSFDGFPAESHESGLDKLTMLDQQNENDRINAIRVPLTDPPEINKLLPSAVERAEKFIFFDEDGNVTALDAELATPSVLRVDIQDGSGGPDSRQLMLSEVVTGGANFPKIGFLNINGANGPVQLDEQGKIPLGLLNIVGLQVRGPFRGDDLCDKPNDEVAACIPPDTRNPSERFTDIPFSNGDMFVIVIEDPEVSGTMNVFQSVGDAAPQILSVKASDAVIFLEETVDPEPPNDILVQEGWYLIESLVDVGDASFIVYDDTGNTYVLGTNVQVALDAIDTVLIAKDAFFTTEQNANRFGISAGADVNGIPASGFYTSPAGTINNPTGDGYSILHTQVSADNATQLAIRIDNGDLYRRAFDTVWTAWERMVNGTELDAVSVVADQGVADAATAQGTANTALATADLAKPEIDFLRTGDRLDIFNVRTS